MEYHEDYARLTVEEFIADCKHGAFIDYDGMGEAEVNGVVLEKDRFKWIYPSKLHEIPEGTTHIRWYNR